MNKITFQNKRKLKYKMRKKKKKIQKNLATQTHLNFSSISFEHTCCFFFLLNLWLNIPVRPTAKATYFLKRDCLK